MSSKAIVNLQLRARDRGDCAKGDLAFRQETIRYFMVYIDVLTHQRRFSVFFNVNQMSTNDIAFQRQSKVMLDPKVRTPFCVKQKTLR